MSNCFVCLEAIFKNYDLVNLFDQSDLKDQLSQAYTIAKKQDNAEIQKVINAYFEWMTKNPASNSSYSKQEIEMNDEPTKIISGSDSSSKGKGANKKFVIKSKSSKSAPVSEKSNNPKVLAVISKSKNGDVLAVKNTKSDEKQEAVEVMEIKENAPIAPATQLNSNFDQKNIGRKSFKLSIGKQFKKAEESKAEAVIDQKTNQAVVNKVNEVSGKDNELKNNKQIEASVSVDGIAEVKKVLAKIPAAEVKQIINEGDKLAAENSEQKADLKARSEKLEAKSAKRSVGKKSKKAARNENDEANKADKNDQKDFGKAELVLPKQEESYYENYKNK